MGNKEEWGFVSMSNRRWKATPLRQKPATCHWHRLLLVAVFYGIFLLGVLGSLRLRPANDDYWIIAEAFSGIPSSLEFWWQNWSGFATTFSLNVLVVGLPGTHLPWALVSSAPFIITSLSVGTVLALLLGWSTGWFGWRHAFALAPLGAVIWWSFLWGTTLVGPAPPLVLGLTHWQNLNAAYVLPLSLLVVGYVWVLFLGRPARSWQRIMFVLVLGLATGLAHLVVSMTILVTIGIVTAVRLLTRSGRGDRSSMLLAAYTVLAILVGQFIALTAPGSRARRGAIAPEAPSSIEFAITSVGRIITQTVTDVSVLVLSLGTALVVVAAGILGFGWADSRTPASFGRLRALFGLGLLVSITASLVTNTLEVFVGFGYWHRSALAVAVFFTAGLGGAYAGAWMKVRYVTNSARPLAALTVVVVLMTLGSTANMFESALSRQSDWEAGPAPLAGVFDDINGPQPWITRNWQIIVDSRDAPRRD